MDELVKMLLDGKSDEEILERIHELEAAHGGPSGLSPRRRR